MRKPAQTEFPVHELIQERWSPRAFDGRAVGVEEVASLMEAARWAPSAFNAQPWAFVVARREDGAEFERAVECLLPANRRWAAAAPVLIVTFARSGPDAEGKRNAFAAHDLGLAVANLTVQATALGLSVHQMAGIDRAAIRAAYAVPEEYEPVSVLAVGYPGGSEALPEDLRAREQAPRTRRAHEEFVFSGAWGQPAALREAVAA